MNLYIYGEVRARTVTLEVIDAEVKDSIEFKLNENPFALKNEINAGKIFDFGEDSANT